jgi:Tfp pilus assembly protein PilX
MMNFHKKQRGYVTLLTTLVLLIVMSLIVVYAAYSVTGQQRVLNNTYNQYQAVQAAEGGLNYAIAYFNTNTTGIFNTIANGSGLGNNQTYTIGTISGNTVQLSNMPISFSASYTQLSPTGSNPSAPVVIQVISTGYSTDNTTQHSISMNIASGNKGKTQCPCFGSKWIC